MARITKVCKTCGSEDVVLDAWAEWDTENQCWELAQTFDAAFCRGCEGDAGLEDRPMPEAFYPEPKP